MRTIFYILGGTLFIAVAWFAYYAISPIFRVVRVDEALPAAPVAEQMVLSDAASSAALAPVPAPAQVRAAEVVGTAGHPASGTARIVSAEGKQYVRYENFKTLNGPDLYVYLSKDLDAKDFVSLGLIRGTEGNINYEVPTGVDASQYPYVLTWCKQFGVLFNYAKVN